MAYKKLFALSMIVATSPVLAAQPEAAPEAGAPMAPADARYCLRVEPVTGSRIETIRCETREAWAQLEVDVDQEWPTEGVRVISSDGINT
jgi:Spy/CpxP family protein refolding chaperone